MKKSYRRILSVGLFVVLIGGLVFALTGCGFLNQAPIAVITTDPAVESGTVEVDVGDPITFMGEESRDIDGEIESYDWDFDDNSSESSDTATGETVQSVSYSVADTYTVTLTVTDDGNKEGTDTVEVDVS